MFYFFKIFLILSISFSALACPFEVGGHTQGLADGMSIGVEDHFHRFMKDQKDIVDEKKFNQIIDQIAAIYKPVFKEMGATLKVHKKWNDGEINAYAHQTGNTWHITLMGGIARHKKQTPDGFAHTVCHEVGHHIAGYPYYPRGWASNEGQANYFATAKCLRELYKTKDNSPFVADAIFDLSNPIEEKCSQIYSFDENAYYTCMRSSLAAVADNSVMADLGGYPMPQVGTPSKAKVRKHYNRHPKPQCQLDTSFQGALCSKASGQLFGTKDYTEGYCSRVDGDTIGVRPACWFSPEQAENELVDNELVDNWF